MTKRKLSDRDGTGDVVRAKDTPWADLTNRDVNVDRTDSCGDSGEN